MLKITCDVICDKCGKNDQVYHEGTDWHSDDACIDVGYEEIEGRHYCEDCRPDEEEDSEVK